MDTKRIAIDDLAVDGVELVEEDLAGVTGGAPPRNSATYIHAGGSTWIPDIDAGF